MSDDQSSLNPIRNEIKILWEDSHILAINKPSGLLSIPDGYNPTLPTVRAILEPEFGKLWIVHRLDKETSGVLLLARNLNNHKSLNMLFETRQVEKTYHAIVIGNPPWDEILIDQPLRINGDRRHRTVIAPLTGKPAQTHVMILERFGEFALVQVSPRTGYTHQIRSHLASIGFPILGDLLYQNKIPLVPEQTKVINRSALHAFSVNLTHPFTKERMFIIAPHPGDFHRACDTLGNLK